MIYRLENEIWSVRLCTVIDFRGSIFSIQHLAFILNTVWGNNNNDNTCNKNDDKVMMGIHMYNNTALCSLNTPLQLELYFQRDWSQIKLHIFIAFWRLYFLSFMLSFIIKYFSADLKYFLKCSEPTKPLPFLLFSYCVFCRLKQF